MKPITPTEWLILRCISVRKQCQIRADRECAETDDKMLFMDLADFFSRLDQWILSHERGHSPNEYRDY